MACGSGRILEAAHGGREWGQATRSIMWGSCCSCLNFRSCTLQQGAELDLWLHCTRLPAKSQELHVSCGESHMMELALAPCICQPCTPGSVLPPALALHSFHPAPALAHSSCHWPCAPAQVHLTPCPLPFPCLLPRVL